MLQLLPKDVVNYICRLVHQTNTQNIVNEYKQRCTQYGIDSSIEYFWYICIRLPEGPSVFNYRHIEGVTNTHVFKRNKSVAPLPKRYIYSGLT